jgi:hypothetical protein
MCDFCEDHDDLFEKPLLCQKLSLGIGGDVYIWLNIDAEKKQIGMHLLNDSNGNTYDFRRECRFCPACGRDFFEVKE